MTYAAPSLATARRIAVACVAVFALVAASTARADFEVTGFDGEVTQADRVTPATQAGSHPYEARTVIEFGGSPFENVKTLVVDLPAGFAGNPTTVLQCTKAQFSSSAGCPSATQVGLTSLTFAGGNVATTYPVYNLEPDPGFPAQFGFTAIGVPTVVNATVRTGAGYGLRVDVGGIPQVLDIVKAGLVFWGVPADPSHDAARMSGAADCFGDALDPAWDPSGCPGGHAANGTPRPFLTNPTDCSTGPVRTDLRADSWQDPGDWKTAFFLTHTPAPENRLIGPENCEKLPFDPEFTFQPTNRTADGPSGYVAHLRFPYDDDPNGLAQAALKKAVVRLPQGVRVSPSSAKGLGACQESEIAIDSDAEPRCPDSSKIGTVKITTPLLDDPLEGSIYLAQPTSAQLLKIYAVARGSGVLVKLPGTIDASNDRQLTATFDNNPQLPFTDFELRFFDGPNASLVNPDTCGTFTTNATMTAYSGKVATTTDSYVVSADGNGTPCGAPGFDPSLIAGTVNSAGGKDSAFTLTFARGDRQQDLSAIDVKMPRGLLARIASADLCGDAAANAGACGAGSQIGRVTVAAGPGPLPYYLPGRVFVTGPYKGAPYGLSIAVPAVAGPFDLGTVIVRAAIFVDRNTAELRIVSEPMPTILQGIALQVRKVNVTVDRPGFMFNPSNCTASRIVGAISSAAGAVVGRSVHFQATNCASLPFAPKMPLKVGAKGKLTRGKRTPFEATVTMPSGQANIRSVQVTLPLALNARLDVVNKRRACTFEQYNADRCPTAVGTGTAVTPLLRDPLKGPAYFVYNPDRRLPDLVVRLKGQVAFDLVGKVSIEKDLRLRTTFDTVPDVPISKFRLSLLSGEGTGPIGTTRSLCSASVRKGLKAEQVFIAQNNKKIARSQKISVAGCGRSAARGRRARHRRSSKSKNARRGSAKRR